MSIRQKLLILFLAISLLPSSLISFLGYVTIKNEITSVVTNQLNTKLSNQIEKINSILEDNRSKILDLVNQYELRSTLKEYIKSKNKIDQNKIATLLQNTKSQSTTLSKIVIVDPKGVILISTDEKDIGTNIANKEYFNKEKKDNNFIIAEDKNDQTDKLYFSNNITFGDEPLGTLVATFTTDDILAIIKDYTNLGQSGETVLSQKGKDRKALSLTQLRFQENAAFRTDVSSFQKVDISDSFSKDIVDYRNHVVLATTTDIDFTNWLLTTKIDKDEAFAPIYRLSNSFILIVLLLSILIFIVALFFAQLFTAPITTLTQKTRRIMQGDFTQRVDVTSSDEIGKLAMAFNTMTEQLQESYQGLEKKVQEKTAELAQRMTETERINKMMIGRELKMIELKKEIEQLKQNNQTTKNIVSPMIEKKEGEEVK